MEQVPAVVGRPVEEVSTPALLLDVDVLESNIAEMARFLSGKEAHLRPHVKTHKCAVIAHKQLAAGARGITCAKLGEAEVMAASGIRDILIANQVIGRDKIDRLVGLTRHSEVIVAVDTDENARDLSDACVQRGTKLNVIVEVDVGLGRCGTRSPEEAVRLAHLLEKLPGLRFRGVMGYEGHTVFIVDAEERRRAGQEANARLVEVRDLIQQSGLPVEIVSAGGTGTFSIAGTYPGITEIQAGSYAIMDARYQSVQGLDFQPALTVLTTIISKPSPDRLVADAGVKCVSSDFGLPQPVGPSGATVFHLSEEYAEIEAQGEAQRLKVGDKIRLLPTHCCTTINQHDYYVGVRRGMVEAVWEISARGRFI